MRELITWRATIKEWLMDDVIDMILSEAGNVSHNKKGQFTAKGEEAKTYSMSKSGARRAGIDDKYVGRGKMTGNRDKDGNPKFNSPFGMNTSDKKQCGRTDFKKDTGKSPSHSCKDYPEMYSEELIEEDELIMDGDEEQDKAYWRSTIKQAIEHEVGRALKQNNCSLTDLMRAMNAWELSKKGKMDKEAD